MPRQSITFWNSPQGNFDLQLHNRYGGWDSSRVISRQTPITNQREASKSIFFNHRAHRLLRGVAPANIRPICIRPHFQDAKAPDQVRPALPQWLCANFQKDIDQVRNSWPGGFDQAGRWSNWPPSESVPNLIELYNLQGRLLRKDWIQTSEIEAAAKWMTRDISEQEADYAIVVMPRIWDSGPNPVFDMRLITEEITEQLKKATYAFFPLFSPQHRHHTGLIVDQSLGMVYWYDPMWDAGSSEKNFVHDIIALKTFYQRMGAPAWVQRLIDVSACVVDGVQQSDQWSCGLWVIEWFRCVVRGNKHHSGDAPGTKKLWQESSSLEQFTDQVVASYIRHITSEFGPPAATYPGLRPTPTFRCQEFIDQQRVLQHTDSSNDSVQILEGEQQSESSWGGISDTPPRPPGTAASRRQNPQASQVSSSDQDLSDLSSTLGNLQVGDQKPVSAIYQTRRAQLTSDEHTQWVQHEKNRRAREAAYWATERIREATDQGPRARSAQFDRLTYIAREHHPLDQVAAATEQYGPYLPPTTSPDFEGYARKDAQTKWDAEN